MRILVVDDNELVREAVRAALSTVGCEVTTACSLREARQCLLEGGWQLLMCDWKLGHERSTAFLCEVRDRFPAIDRILMTTLPAADWCQLLETGLVRAAIRKPFGLRDMLDVVHAH
jgi:DNA-binding response OmpR family regulator